MRAALVIMGIFSLYSLGLRLINFLQGTRDLFAWEFEGLILYLPTALLLGVILYERRRRLQRFTIVSAAAQKAV